MSKYYESSSLSTSPLSSGSSSKTAKSSSSSPITSNSDFRYFYYNNAYIDFNTKVWFQFEVSFAHELSQFLTILLKFYLKFL